MRPPISNRCPAVAVEYDCHGKRKTRTFSNAFLARQFYTQKQRAGRNPKVRKP